MNTINMPTFTAEASLYRSTRLYRGLRTAFYSSRDSLIGLSSSYSDCINDALLAEEACMQYCHGETHCKYNCIYEGNAAKAACQGNGGNGGNGGLDCSPGVDCEGVCGVDCQDGTCCQGSDSTCCGNDKCCDSGRACCGNHCCPRGWDCSKIFGNKLCLP